MEGPKSPTTFELPYGHYGQRPTSPPVTPGTHSHPRFPSIATHASLSNKRMGGLYVLAQSPPFEHIEPIGQGHQFRYTRRPQSSAYSSRPSSASGVACASRESVADASESEELNNHPTPPRRRVEHPNFEIEEISDDDIGYDSVDEVVRPDKYEDATSDKGADEQLEKETALVSGLQKLHCRQSSDSTDEQMRRYRAKKKRWSQGKFKRSHSQSVGSDSDIDDTEELDAHDVGSSARRLRRRIRGPGDRSSLIFEDIPTSNIAEVDEPDDGGNQKGPPSLDSDAEEFTLDALPFWVLEDPMEIDSGSSTDSSAE